MEARGFSISRLTIAAQPEAVLTSLRRLAGSGGLAAMTSPRRTAEGTSVTVDLRSGRGEESWSVNAGLFLSSADGGRTTSILVAGQPQNINNLAGFAAEVEAGTNLPVLRQDFAD